MILPTKHVSTAHSLIGCGALLLERLPSPRTVTSLWDEVHRREEIGTFEHFALALDFLYSIGTIDLHDGLLHRRS